jgi:hypothetical protein
MMRSLRYVVLCFLIFSIQERSLSQAIADTAFVTASSANAVKKYSDFIQGQTGLYIGSQYKTDNRTNEEHPFYIDIDWFQGNVNYNGEFYDNGSFIYDLTSDNLITEHLYNGEEIVLVKTKVERFMIAGNEFVHLNGSGLLPGLPDAGFYHVLYDGPTRVVGRYTKLMEEKIESNKIERYFTMRSRYYILKDGVYHKIAKRNEVLKLFEDRKQAVRSYLAENKIRVSKSNPSSFALAAAYYDSLNSQTK